MNNTKFMTKVFSDATPEEFKQEVINKVEEAKSEGSSTLEEGEDVLEFAALDESTVIVEDKSTGEVTKIMDNPEDEDDLELEGVIVDEKEFSSNEAPDSLPDVDTKVPEGVDGDHVTDSVPSVESPVSEGIDGKHESGTLPEVEVSINEGIEDAEKAGMKTYSVGKVRLKNFSDPAKAARMLRSIRKAFSDDPMTEAEALDELKEEKEVDPVPTSTVVENVVENEAKTESDAGDGADELQKDLKELGKKVEELKETHDKELAEEAKTMTEDILSRAEALEDKGEEFEAVRDMCDNYSKCYSEILDEVAVTAAEEGKEVEGEVKVEDKESSSSETEVTEDQPKVTAEATPIEVLLGGSASEDVDIEPRIDPNEAEEGEKVFSTTGGRGSAGIYFEPF